MLMESTFRNGLHLDVDVAFVMWRPLRKVDSTAVTNSLELCEKPMAEKVPSFGDFKKRYYLPARPFGFALFRLYFRLKVTGIEHVPRTGPVILVPNHGSFLDPPLLASIVPRVIYFLMLHHHYYHPVFHWLFGRLPCIPVKRSSITGGTALRHCLQVLQHGQVVCIFPEGGIHHKHKAGGPGHGAALLALRAQAPLVPVGINGTSEALRLHQRFPRPKHVKINIGEPLYLEPRDTYERSVLQEIMENAMVRIQSLVSD